jgi:hypothetical protein
MHDLMRITRDRRHAAAGRLDRLKRGSLPRWKYGYNSSLNVSSNVLSCHTAHPARALLLALVFVAGCGGPQTDPAGSQAPAAPGESPWFTDGAGAAGLDFVHFNGMSGETYYPEIMGPGVALLDYDNDGDLDVYLVQGQMLGNKPLSEATYPPRDSLRDRLYRNDLTVNADGSRTLRFTDVTDASGLVVESYGMGVAAGDYDNDGWVDLYRTRLGANQLFHNNGDGTFTDVSRASGTDDGGWGVSASFVDIDRDGWLDLYVGNYLVYSLAGDIDCLAVSGQSDYCPPNSYRAQPDRLYRNRRNGTFEDVTSRALVGGAYGPALGVSTADFNGDGWADIYVANDGEENQLWINQQNGTFRETGFLSGAAVNAAGNAESSMGVDAGDLDNDGDEDLFMTHWLSQTNTLYVNDGTGSFQDRTAYSRLGPPSFARTGFGTGWLDYDNDSLLDLLVVNGSVSMIEAQARAGDRFPLRQPDQLFRNVGDGRFEDVSDQAGPALSVEQVSRGTAFGDVDNDGDVDVLVGDAAAPVRLLLNQVGNRQSWVGLRLVTGRRDALGARVGVELADGRTLWRRARADGSYASASDPRVLVGLGTAPGIARVLVRWPSGRMEELTGVASGTWTTLTEGR